MNRFNFVRLAAACIRTAVANPTRNADEIIDVLSKVADSDVVVFPELSITGYTCADLFGQQRLLDAGIDQTIRIAQAARGREQLIVVGLPVPLESSLYNCAAVLFDGQVLRRELSVEKEIVRFAFAFVDVLWLQDGRNAVGQGETTTRTL